MIVKAIMRAFRMLMVQGLPWRGHRNERAGDILKPHARLGNILAVIRLMIESDSILNEHIRGLAAAEEQNRSSAGVVGRGSTVSWLSHTTMENILTVFVNSIQKRVVARLKKDGVFSIQLDSTTDVATMDQLCLVVRSVRKQYIDAPQGESQPPQTEMIEERLLDVCKVIRGRADNLFELTTEMMDRAGLNWRKFCIAHSFDGASVMHRLAEKFRDATDNVNQHVWCHSHRLSLAVVDHCKDPQDTATQVLFANVQSACNFFTAGYKRHEVFREAIKGNRKGHRACQGLKKFLTHKWHGRYHSLRSIFGRWHGPAADQQLRDGLIIEVIQSLHSIDADTDFVPETRGDAHGLLMNFLRKETIIIALAYTEILSFVDKVMATMQSRDSDYSSDTQLVQKLETQVKRAQRQFDHFWTTAQAYCTALQAAV